MRDGFPGGLLTGVVGTLVLCWLIDPRLGPIIGNEAASFFAIVATLGAAYIAHLGIRKQIAHQNRIEDDRRLAHLEAERATLPLALARVCEICRRGIQDLVGLDELFGKPDNENMVLEETYIESIKAAIRFSDGPVRVRLQAILRGYQLAMASTDWEDLEPLAKTPDEQNKDGYIRISLCYRWAIVYALAVSLFDFSRGKEAVFAAEFPDKNFSSSLLSANVPAARFTDFQGFFDRMVDRDRQKSIEELFID